MITNNLLVHDVADLPSASGVPAAARSPLRRGGPTGYAGWSPAYPGLGVCMCIKMILIDHRSAGSNARWLAWRFGNRRTQSRTARLETWSIKAQAERSQSSILDGLIDLPCWGPAPQPQCSVVPSISPLPISLWHLSVCSLASCYVVLPVVVPLPACPAAHTGNTVSAFAWCPVVAHCTDLKCKSISRRGHQVCNCCRESSTFLKSLVHAMNFFF
jgi:hypothetical protein